MRKKRAGPAHESALVEAIVQMLRQRAEDGVIHITDDAVEAFIRDALTRMIQSHGAGDEVRA